METNEKIGPSYIGTKTLNTKPMNLGEYNKERGWTIPENEDPERTGYMVQYEDGYISWSPKEVFESAYHLANKLTFGMAVEALKTGHKVARQGWNGKGMFLFYNDDRANAIGHKALNEKIIDEILEVCPFIVMKTADNKLIPWLASQSDVLAEDYSIIL